MKFTVFGGAGFVGRHLVTHLRERGYEVTAPVRGALVHSEENLGHVIYAIGLTANFRSRPHDTVEAHVGLLSTLLQSSRFDSWLYLSSTRVYASLAPTDSAKEDAKISIAPSADSLYDLSKLLGEALCLTQASPAVRVARLSNVYGPGQGKATFLASVIRELRETNSVTIHESPTSCKDYVDIDDVVPLLENIAISGRQRLYNVASGQSVCHAELARELAALTGAHISFAPGAPERIFPTVDIAAVTTEFHYLPMKLKDRLSGLLSTYPIQHGVPL